MHCGCLHIGEATNGGLDDYFRIGERVVLTSVDHFTRTTIEERIFWHDWEYRAYVCIGNGRNTPWLGMT